MNTVLVFALLAVAFGVFTVLIAQNAAKTKKENPGDGGSTSTSTGDGSDCGPSDGGGCDGGGD